MKKVNIIIRKARCSDLESLLFLLSQLSPVINSEKINKRLSLILKRIINDKNYILVVAKFDNNIVGTALLLVQLNLTHGGKPYGHIENVVVKKNLRGLGIGKMLIEYLDIQSKKRGCYKVILNCKKNNIIFYEKKGFKKTGQIEMRIDYKRI